MGNDGSGLEVFSPKMWILSKGVYREVVWGDALRLAPGEELYMRVDGRTPLPDKLKMNPLWWSLNDWDTTPPDWSMPDAPYWLRALNWWFRNPFHNLGRYVLGVGDQNYIVRIYQRDGYETKTNADGGVSVELVGWEKGEIILYNGTRLPWISYSSDKLLWYWGWQPTGFAGLKINRYPAVALPVVALAAPAAFLSLIFERAWSALTEKGQAVPVLPA